MVVLWDLKDPEAGERIAQLPNSVYALHYLPGPDLLLQVITMRASMCWIGRTKRKSHPSR